MKAVNYGFCMTHVVSLRTLCRLLRALNEEPVPTGGGGEMYKINLH